MITLYSTSPYAFVSRVVCHLMSMCYLCYCPSLEYVDQFVLDILLDVLGKANRPSACLFVAVEI
jgi:hypothetical protein